MEKALANATMPWMTIIHVYCCEAMKLCEKRTAVQHATYYMRFPSQGFPRELRRHVCCVQTTSRAAGTLMYRHYAFGCAWFAFPRSATTNGGEVRDYNT